MNDVSIIINGVRYDAVLPLADICCDECDLADFCKKAELNFTTCLALIGLDKCFKRSTKSFER